MVALIGELRIAPRAELYLDAHHVAARLGGLRMNARRAAAFSDERTVKGSRPYAAPARAVSRRDCAARGGRGAAMSEAEQRARNRARRE